MSLPRLPLPLVSSLSRTLKSATAAVPSAFTGSEQVQDWGGRWWHYEIEMALSKGSDGRLLSAFFASLGGAAGRFLLPDPSASHQATVAGTPVATGSAQSGNTLLTSGWAPGGEGLKAGDLFSLGSDTATRLYQLTADVAPDGVGDAMLSFVPPLRTSPPDQAALNVTAPEVCLRLTSPVPTRISRADSYRFTLTAREAL